MVQWGIFDNVVTDSSPQMIENFYNFILDYPLPVIWYAHNAQYDWRYLMDYIIEQELPVEIGMRTENDIYEIRIITDKGPVIMRDSFAFWPESLEKLAETFCPELPKLKIDIENFDPTNPEHIEYAKRDVKILLTGMPRLNAKWHSLFGVNINATTASTALKSWQKTLPENEIYDASVLNDREIFIRQAYYGGLVFLTRTDVVKNARTYDVNSSYPSVMCDYGVPYGREVETSDYCEELPGIYHCRVRAPDDLIVPIIPARNKAGAMRWYRGEFDTVCTNKELIFAAKHGYEILEIYSGIAWEKMVFPFSDFVEICKSIRVKYKGLSEEKLAKLAQNSLYGKFGSRRERRKMLARHMMNEDDLIDAIPYDENGNWYVRIDPDDTGRTKPEWAVFITAHGRLKLLQAIYSIGVENVIYGDTDSITILAGSEGNLNIGNDYGQFKFEKEWAEFRAIAPKVYAGTLASGKDAGKYKGAAKGLPQKNLTQDHWRSLLEDGKTEGQALSLNSLRVSLKNGVKPAVLLNRKSSTLANSQNYTDLQNGKIELKYAA